MGAATSSDARQRRQRRSFEARFALGSAIERNSSVIEVEPRRTSIGEPRDLPISPLGAERYPARFRAAEHL
jgi:hypothetical protein